MHDDHHLESLIIARSDDWKSHKCLKNQKFPTVAFKAILPIHVAIKNGTFLSILDAMNFC